MPNGIYTGTLGSGGDSSVDSAESGGDPHK